MARAADPLDELYAAPPARFVATRNALAERLARAGKTGPAREVRKLRKPTVAVWAIDRVAREAPKRVERFLAAFDQMKHAQLRDSANVEKAAEALSAAVDAFLDEAREALTASGGTWTLDVQRRVSATLHGAAADARQRARLVSGTLEDELPAPGFEVFGEAARGRRR